MSSPNNLFYAEHISETEILLTDQEASHAAQVLRKRVGDEIFVIDGKGGLYRCEISAVSKKEITCRIVDVETFPNPEQLTIAVAPTKNRDRLEWMIEKLVEIGVRQIILLETKNTVRTKTNITRIKKKILSAVKQSLRYHIPQVSEMSLEKVLQLEAGEKYIAHCFDGLDKSENKVVLETQKLILIGPEGDFTREEVELAMKAGFVGLDLGEFRLRTETAAIVAASRFR